MCKISVNQIVELAEQLRDQSVQNAATSNKVADQLRAMAKRLRNEADMLDRLASNLSNGLSSGEPAGRRTVALKEGERHPRAPKPGRKPKAKVQKPKAPISDERRAQLQEQCRRMREAKQKNALVEKFAETKIS